ncbi:hypothetical protein RJ641_000816, partial [Dillenia turbinata]
MNMFLSSDMLKSLPVGRYYLTKASSNPGAGDILMGFWDLLFFLLPFQCSNKERCQFISHSSCSCSNWVGWSNFVQAMLDKLQFHDPIARGIATASSSSSQTKLDCCGWLNALRILDNQFLVKPIWASDAVVGGKFEHFQYQKQL